MSADQRQHAVAEMVTFELTAFRRHLEHALSLPTLPSSCWAPREELQRQLDAVLAEEAERERIQRANNSTP
jgi:hypothetical protein